MNRAIYPLALFSGRIQRNPDFCAIQQWGSAPDIGAMINNAHDVVGIVENWNYGTELKDETWERVEVYFEESSAPGGTFDGTEDGTLQMWKQDDLFYRR